ncbi:hypothetical protein BV22DRAFT_65524 [Leucogyrophana mollusca]|uniref:Uncharacterized protein n=1 Tax=Leucogyrophana mollusca TaxID=85980 RepID=A0ACB8BY98_9AGAM|nr:hypothetical protein BV22DRAFT_65524 [Leucogyrophana mollusca]
MASVGLLPKAIFLLLYLDKTISLANVPHNLPPFPEVPFSSLIAEQCTLGGRSWEQMTLFAVPMWRLDGMTLVTEYSCGCRMTCKGLSKP